MNWVDYAILGVVALSVLIGLWRGFLREVAALAIWIAAFWVAWQFSDEGARILEPHVDLPSARMAIAFGLLFLAALIVGALLNFVLSRLVESTGLSGTDRLLGLFFGLGRALVLLVAVLLLAGLTPLPQDPWWRESLLIPRLQVLAEWAVEAMPREVRGYFDFSPVPPSPDRGEGEPSRT